jgi:hypothetical protein
VVGGNAGVGVGVDGYVIVGGYVVEGSVEGGNVEGMPGTEIVGGNAGVGVPGKTGMGCTGPSRMRARYGVPRQPTSASTVQSPSSVRIVLAAWRSMILNQFVLSVLCQFK